MEVDWTYTEKGFLCHGEQALSWNPKDIIEKEDHEGAGGK
jgi:hypothetical protein